jgi:hypothetical protein
MGTFNDLMNMLPEAQDAHLSLQTLTPNCTYCSTPITNQSDEKYSINEKPVHEDCFFENWGTHIESHSIRNLRQPTRLYPAPAQIATPRQNGLPILTDEIYELWGDAVEDVPIRSPNLVTRLYRR